MDIKTTLEAATLSGQELKLFPYRLYAITSHSGSLYGGQYISYVRHGDDWYFINDVYWKKVDKTQALEAESYLLFYQRLW